jgi:hypothetical protein
MEDGVESEVFGCTIPHQWFMCMWDSKIRKRLQSAARSHGAVVVMGCHSATVTVNEAVESLGCKVVEGMETTGIMNAQLSVQWPGEIRFEDCKTVPLLQEGSENMQV